MTSCAACGQPNPDGARFCNGCGAALATASAPREERKVVSIVFVDLVGSTARAEGLDPEDVRALLSSYHARVRHELEMHGGVVEKFIGDAVVAVFGAPVAHEDDPERAVRAALAIHEAITELNEAQPALQLEVRIGVNTGDALVALDARPEAGEGMVSGDVINTAARLQAAAPPGGILVGDRARRATARAIDYAQHEPILAKGKAEPVVAWLAVGRRASFGVEDVAVGHALLVGREREVALLSDALARARRDERPQLVTLVGVPGIGKSRLVQELRAVVEADPGLITWRRGRSLPYGEGVAYWALGEIVKAQAGVLESDAAEAASAKLARAVADLVPDPNEAAWVTRQVGPLAGLTRGDGPPSRDEAFAAWRRLLEALAEQRPTVLVFEDLHWADDDLLDFVDGLVDALEAVPLLLVCTARPELLDRRPGWGGGKLNAHTISLAPLTDDETASLLHLLVERRLLPVDTLGRLIERAEGVPLFAEEYARLLEAGSQQPEFPESLQGLVTARIDGLSAPLKGVLQDAAVLGKVFWTDALGQLSGLEATELDERLRALERQEFVRRERRSAIEGARQYVFLHALVREVAYGEIPRAARSDKHRRAADWLGALARDRGDDHAEVLAHHLEAAMTYGAAAGVATDDLRPRLVEALRDAGDRARALSNVSRAVAYYRRAIEASPERPDPELLLLHAEAATWAHGVETGTAVLEEAVAALMEAGRTELAAQALTFLERALWRSGHPDLSLLDRALELVSGVGPTPVRGRVLSAAAVRWAISGRANEALPLAHEALEIARAHGDRTDEAEALTNAAVVEVNAGNLFGGLETAREGLELALECGTSYLPRLYNNLASFEYSVGDLAAAGQYIREGLALAERLGTGGIVDAITAALAGDHFDAGRWDEALELVRTLIGKHLGGGTPHYSDPSLQLIEAAIVLAREGQLPARMLDDVLRAARAIGDPQVVIPALADAAALQAAAGRVDEAVALLSEYREALQADPSWQNEGSHQVTAVIAWRELMGEPVPEEVLRGSPVPWVEAARLVAHGQAIAAADALAAIEARTLEAQVRFHAARAAAQAGHDLAEAARQLDLATGFWRSVGATAQLAQADEVRVLMRAAAS